MPTNDQIEAATQAMMRKGNYRESSRREMRELAVAALVAAEAMELRKIIAHRNSGRRIESAKRAFERRFGKNGPLTVTRFQLDDGRQAVRIQASTGAWMEFSIENKRLMPLQQSQAPLSINR